MEYNLSHMEPTTFENLSQSLFQGLLGPTCKVYGKGPDGQREAVCQIDNPQDILGQQICGRTFLQSKHKSSQTKTDDLTWIKSELKKEFDGLYEKKKIEPSYLPQNYFFFTNIILTPVKEKGTKDKIDKYVDEFKDIVPNIYVIGYDEICTMLDNNSDVRRTYYSFLVSGDIIDELYKWMVNSQEQHHKEVNNALQRFIDTEFSEDQYSRLEQAGDLTDNRIALEKVFVDLEASPLGIAGGSYGKFISHVINVANHPLNNSIEQRGMVNRFVLLGGAGQGKSTIGQYLTQIYRAYLLDLDNDCVASSDAKSFVHSFKEDYGYDIKCVRTPVRIILKEYAAWIKKNQNSACGVLDYIVNQINKKASAGCDIERLREFIKIRSWIFIFDGLDEVPSSSNRADVLKHISNFIDIELRRLDCDALIIATTRQQGYNDDFSESKYSHLHLLDMNDEICLQYLNKLTNQIEPSVDERKNIMATLKETLSDPIVSKLMRRPLHASIVTILVRSGGKPPRDKYALFKEYTEIVIRRERQKNINKVLSEYESLIMEIHEESAYLLQEESSRSGNPAAVLPKSKLISLITRRMQNIEIEDEKKEKITVEIYEIATLRLSYLSAVHEDELEFPIRSVQEYFAANFLIKHRREDEIIKIIQNIAASGYWRNIFVFAVSYFLKERDHLEGTIDSICGELNGSTIEPDKYGIEKGAQAGAWLALDLLSENIFANKPQIENKYIKHAANILSLSYVAPAATKITTLPQNILSKFIKSHLRPFVQQFPHSESAWIILWHLIENRNQLAIELAEDVLKQSDVDMNVIFMCSHFSNDNIPGNCGWLMAYISNWFKSGNTFPAKKVFFLYTRTFMKEVKRNADDRLFMSCFVKSVLLTADHNFGYSRNEPYSFSFCGIELNKIGQLLADKEMYSVSKYVEVGFLLTSIDQEYKDAIKMLGEVCHDLKLDFFKKWSDYILSSSNQDLIEMISAYYEENESIKQKLAPYFRFSLPLSIIYSTCLEKAICCEDVINFIENDFNSSLQLLEKEIKEVETNINLLQEKKHSDIFEFLHYRITCNNAALQEFVSDFQVTICEIPNYSLAFLKMIRFVTVITCEYSSIEFLLKSKEYIKVISIIRDCHNNSSMLPNDRMWLRELTIYLLASSTILEDTNSLFYEFQDENPILRRRTSIDSEACSIAYNKIIKRVSFDEKEHESLKIVPFIINETHSRISSSNITVFESFRCTNVYNEFGRLLICLFGNYTQLPNDFIELVKTLDIVYVSNCVASVVSEYNLSTDAVKNTIIVLYSELQAIKEKNEKINGAISLLEKAMLEISTNSICTPISS